MSTPTRRSSRIALLSSPQAYTGEELNNFNSTFQETTNNYADIDKNDSESNTVDPSEHYSCSQIIMHVILVKLISLKLKKKSLRYTCFDARRRF